jgi:hypothetical protein
VLLSASRLLTKLQADDEGPKQLKHRRMGSIADLLEMASSSAPYQVLELGGQEISSSASRYVVTWAGML